MNRHEFEIFRSFAEERDPHSCCPDPAVLGLTIKKLEGKGFLRAESVTPEGYQALEPYRVKRAVFLAAGLGSRMKPITINTPKPMVRVHGKRIIETLLEAMVTLGITEIYIVCGYLAEEFELLKAKYPSIVTINNPDYMKAGTIASFYYARELLANAYVFESDLVLLNPQVLHKYFWTSAFMGTKVDSTDDWFLKTRNDGIITEVGIGGTGENCYKLFGVSYWDEKDGTELAKDLKGTYESPDGYRLPMSHVPFRVYKDKYSVEIMECGFYDFVEIDTFTELQAFDDAYSTGI